MYANPPTFATIPAQPISQHRLLKSEKKSGQFNVVEVIRGITKYGSSSERSLANREPSHRESARVTGPGTGRGSARGNSRQLRTCMGTNDQEVNKDLIECIELKRPTVQSNAESMTVKTTSLERMEQEAVIE